MTHSFSIRESIRFGWHTLKRHSGLVFQVVVTIFAIQVVSAVVQKTLAGTGIGSLADLLLGVLSIFVSVGATLIALMLAKGEHTEYRSILPPWRLVLRFFCSGILAGLAAAVPLIIGGALALATGFITLGDFLSFSEGAVTAAAFGAKAIGGIIALCVIALVSIAAAAYIGLRYSMARFEILEGAGIVESLRKSAVITRGKVWKLFYLVLVLVLLNMLGAILLLVGLLVTVPITIFAFAHVYLKLKEHHTH